MPEVQIYIEAFYVLKESQHKTYELDRAEKLDDLLLPIFEPDLRSMGDATRADLKLDTRYGLGGL